MKVFTVMRTQDNLSESISSFYAELDRINHLLEKISDDNKVLYFLDELLKGTNSADRHKGAEALVKQLIALKVSGFVSTHDIELGQLTQQMDEVTNYSFESTITDGQINFDYLLRDGICSSFNASELMRQMGIEV
jgi:DNA mismatch repair ATPase MutS